ncbi:MAG: MBOAT family O-acyltransferase [Sarcina sp.]
MVFSSLLFIFRFLPLVLIFYFLAPFKIKNFILLTFSFLFYSFGEPKYITLMVASIFVDYTMGIFIEKSGDNLIKRKLFLIGSLFFNISVLFIFKYFNFFVDSLNTLSFFDIKMAKIALPLGISFYTFQTMSYTIDVYKGRIKAEKNLISFATFVTLFPQLIAGPIVKYSDIDGELNNKNRVTIDKIERGIKLFILGLGKKVIIANNIGMLWNEIEGLGFQSIGTGLAWLGAIAFSIQIYFDFSGYSLMARGLGAILGFEFPINFNYPFISKSITEFWRRWHITLGSWFKEYVYIELGGNRVSYVRVILNLFIVWAITGLWHGASYNFVLWGGYFFALIVIEKSFLLKILEKHKVISHIYTLILILVSFVIFAITDFNSMMIYLSKMFTFSAGISAIYYLRNYFLVIIIAILISMPLSKNIYKKYLGKNEILTYIILFIIFFISVAYLVDSTYNPFLYFRF